MFMVNHWDTIEKYNTIVSIMSSFKLHDTMVIKRIKKISYDQKYTSIIQNYYRISDTHNHMVASVAAAPITHSEIYSAYEKRERVVNENMDSFWCHLYGKS